MTPRNRAGPSAPRRAAKRVRPDGLLRELIGERTVLCLASSSRRGPWCAPLFFAPIDGGARLVFVTDPKSRHGRELAADPRAAAAVWFETTDATQVRGVQLAGASSRHSGRDERRARAAFLRRHPRAAPFLAKRPHERFFAFAVARAKVTDNRQGFGFKVELAPGRARAQRGSR
jgi:uncharacterized protein YhbP (UPF0306 family)